MPAGRRRRRDAQNRITEARTQAGSLIASYAYDGSFLRVKKDDGSTVTVYVFSGTKVIAEYANGSLSKEYIYAGSQLLATLEGSTTKYHHADHLSVRMTTDSAGSVLGEQGHYPFGEAWYSVSTTTKWQFTSYERDSDSGLDYAIFRYHASRLGRFMTPDPLAGLMTDPQSLNRLLPRLQPFSSTSKVLSLGEGQTLQQEHKLLSPVRSKHAHLFCLTKSAMRREPYVRTAPMVSKRKIRTMPILSSIVKKQLRILATTNKSRSKSSFYAAVLCLLFFSGCCCEEKGLRVQQIATPEYPLAAHSRNIEGTVEVHVEIGPDGKVLSARGSGAHPLWVEATEQNIRHWIFGPFPPVGDFPIYHTVTYEYKLEGKPLFIVRQPLIRTFLPHRLEIVTRPLESDYSTAPSTSPEG